MHFRPGVKAVVVPGTSMQALLGVDMTHQLAAFGHVICNTE